MLTTLTSAILSALLLVFLVAPLERLFGLPASVANKLAVPAFCFAIYSFGCYFLKPTPWQPWLKLIAVANLLYCCATIAILFIYRMSITPFGIAYFAGEILIVLMLLLWEWRLATTEA
jgi:hypothetical protein